MFIVKSHSARYDNHDSIRGYVTTDLALFFNYDNALSYAEWYCPEPDFEFGVTIQMRVNGKDRHIPERVDSGYVLPDPTMDPLSSEYIPF